MKLNALLSVFAAVAAITCVCFVVFPAFSLNRFGVAAEIQSVVPLQLAGALFGGLAVMAWMARNAGPSSSRDAMVLGFAALNVLAAVVTIAGARSGAFDEIAWVPVITFALFATAFLSAARGTRRASVE